MLPESFLTCGFIQQNTEYMKIYSNILRFFRKKH